MAVTYFCTDKHGNTYWRCSAGHTQPLYKWAAIYREAGSTEPVEKHMISYSSKSRRPELRPAHNEVDVVEVRAYLGRLKVEPAPVPVEAPADQMFPRATKTLRQHIQAALASDEHVDVVETQIEPTDDGFEVYIDGSAKAIFPTLEAAEAFAERRKRGF